MATVIGEIVTTPFHSHNMIANPPRQHPHHHTNHHDTSSPYRSTSRPRTFTTASATKRQRSESAVQVGASGGAGAGTDEPDKSDKRRSPRRRDTSSCAIEAPAPIPSPPASSSPPAASNSAVTNHVSTASMTSLAVDASSVLACAEESSVSNAQQPSPVSENASVPAAEAPAPAPAPAQKTVRVRDLAHVNLLAQAEILSDAVTTNEMAAQTKYDISGMPIGDIIEMVAALLTKITSTNDLQHNAMQRNVTHQQQANEPSDTSGQSQINPVSHSVLAFHGKNVPAITIHSYLARIHKYCPTTFEVFLSLLVYFDRMTERVNGLVTKNEDARWRVASQPQTPTSSSTEDVDAAMQNEDSTSGETDSDLVDDDEENVEVPVKETVITASGEILATHGPVTYFVVDSFNIHRLIIAGVTCSSKFFSDVFYTNSRYAKVGGLPLVELNHLELQFLILNTFRLSIPVETLEAYATMLVEFFAREVISKEPKE